MLKIDSLTKEVDRKVNVHIQNLIGQKVNEFIEDINKKSLFYLGLSVFSLFLIFVPLPKVLVYCLFFLILAAVCYQLFTLLRVLRRFFQWTDGFDRNIKNLVEKEIKKSLKGAPFSSRMALWLSGRRDEDIEHLCISYSVRELARQLKKQKIAILIRITAYTVIVILFREIFFIIPTQ